MFLSAAYEPRFMFDFTPFYLLSGMSNMQLLVLTLVMMAADLLLHLRGQRRGLVLSFLPTSIMISGIGISIMTNQVDLSYVCHYVLFGCLLFVVLIDYRYVLAGGGYPLGPGRKQHVQRPEVGASRLPIFSKPLRGSQRDLPAFPVVSTDEFHEMIDGFFEKVDIVIKDLEQNTRRIEALEHSLENGQKILLSREAMFTDRIVYYLGTMEQLRSRKQNQHHSLSRDKTTQSHKTMLDVYKEVHSNDLAVILKRGIIKDISCSLAGLLGYRQSELLEKNFFTFVNPQALKEVEKFYVDRLKGAALKSFQASLFGRSQEEFRVAITVTPALFEGEAVEFLHIQVLDNNTAVAVPLHHL